MFHHTLSALIIFSFLFLSSLLPVAAQLVRLSQKYSPKRNRCKIFGFGIEVMPAMCCSRGHAMASMIPLVFDATFRNSTDYFFGAEPGHVLSQFTNDRCRSNLSVCPIRSPSPPRPLLR